MTQKMLNKFSDYPNQIRPKMEYLRQLIYSIAEKENLGEVEESLKWGEPSYKVKYGSPVRMDWKEKSPDRYALYFNCNTRLVDTFKELYRDVFSFEGNRAIHFKLEDELPVNELEHCLSIAMNYQKLKHLPLLGG